MWRMRRALRPLLGLFAGYAVMGLGLLAVIGYLGTQALDRRPPSRRRATCSRCSRSTRSRSCSRRKALPRRWAPVLGALLVALAIAHNLFAETLTISRYYG